MRRWDKDLRVKTIPKSPVNNSVGQTAAWRHVFCLTAFLKGPNQPKIAPTFAPRCLNQPSAKMRVWSKGNTSACWEIMTKVCRLINQRRPLASRALSPSPAKHLGEARAVHKNNLQPIKPTSAICHFSQLIIKSVGSPWAQSNLANLRCESGLCDLPLTLEMRKIETVIRNSAVSKNAATYC